MSRRGVVYLFSALLLVALLLTVMYAQTLPTSRELAESEGIRIMTMSDFLKDFHSDVHRATYIAGFRAFIGLEQYISEEGSFVTNTSPIFIEAFLNGTIDNKSYEILENSTFGEYLRRVNAEARDIGITLNISVTDITLTQGTPWTVDISFNTTVNVSDAANLSRWDYERSFTTEVSIIDIRDPVFSVNTLGKLPNTIRKSPYNNSDFVGPGNDTTYLLDELNYMYYREDPHAPSFLQRLSGNLSGSSKYGISTAINLDDLDAQGIFVDNSLSVIDYLYFTNASTTNYCHDEDSNPTPELHDWFKIDETHFLDPAHDYGLDELNGSTDHC